jgi:hypothetical protein
LPTSRDADFLPPMHLTDSCASAPKTMWGVPAASCDPPATSAGAPRVRGRHHVARAAGNPSFPDRFQFAASGAKVTHAIERTEHNVAIDDAVFIQPLR